MYRTFPHVFFGWTRRAGVLFFVLMAWMATGLSENTPMDPSASGAPPPSGTVPHWKLLTDRAGGAKGAIVLKDGRFLTTRTEPDGTGSQVILSQSRDGGATWENATTICRSGADVSLGDGHLIETRSGLLLYCYRENRFAGSRAAERSYAIRVAQSTNGG
ncbi:MAG: exo-alpha-sialidase, partial [Verrucomicrobia bacterium]|nr:exo-alpha-sialidase [Verrucomicrobiota bacterium]